MHKSSCFFDTSSPEALGRVTEGLRRACRAADESPSVSPLRGAARSDSSISTDDGAPGHELVPEEARGEWLRAVFLNPFTDEGTVQQIIAALDAFASEAATP